MRFLLALFTAAALSAQIPSVRIDTPMETPEWAKLERQLLERNSIAVKRFADAYVDDRGYLLHTPRWGTLDGPDDAIETFYNWTLLHALGGDDEILDLWEKAYEGHLAQYSELRTETTDLAKNGAYIDDFITQSDWFHTAEGMRGFFMQGLSDPADPKYIERMKRFADLYNDNQPANPNYDHKHKVIRSIWNGAMGAMTRHATVYDWIGDPVEGRFHLLHNPARGSEMFDLLPMYSRMLAHCEEYLDSRGDTNLNLGATLLSVNAYALTGEKKYRDWSLEYINAWKDRSVANGNNIPSNIGLDGTVGGTYGGKWYKGTYGWNFSIYDGELREVAHRNYFPHGSWPGFANGLILTGDQSYVDVLRGQIDNMYAHKRIKDGETLIPRMFGDPRGYRYSGREEWYHWTNELFHDRLTEIYLWSMDPKDRERLPETGWAAFLEGQDPGYPVRALGSGLEHVADREEVLANDITTPETRLADWPLRVTPATIKELVQLMWGGYFPNGRIWFLHSRLRYFDPVEERAGIPADVAALVEKLSSDEVTVTLVNTSKTAARRVIVQAGGYAEHTFTNATINGKTTPINGTHVEVALAPGSGATLVLGQERYTNQPNLKHPF